MQEHMMESISQRFCPVCGKQFTVLWPSQWGYKRGNVNNQKYLCSWSCLRKYDKGEIQMDEKTKEARQERLDELTQRVAAGMTYREALHDMGYDGKSAGQTYRQIRNFAMMMHPEQAKAMPESIRDEPKTTAADAMEGMQEAADEFFGQCEDMGLKTEAPEEPKLCYQDEFTAWEGDQITEHIFNPVVYDGMAVRAVEGDFGSYHYQEINGKKWIDYDDKEVANQLSMTVEQWRGFLQEIRKAALILGVEL